MSLTLHLQVPGLKPRAAEVVGMVGTLEQKEEFSLAILVAETGEVEQPRDSMFPAVKVILGLLVTKTPPLPPGRHHGRPGPTPRTGLQDRQLSRGCTEDLIGDL